MEEPPDSPSSLRKSPPFLSTQEEPNDNNYNNPIITTVDSNQTVDDHDHDHLSHSRPMTITDKRKKKKRIFKNNVSATAMESSTSSCASSSRKGVRVGLNRRNPKVTWRDGGSGGGGRGSSDMEAIALPLGMSFAAVVAQVSERRDAAGERMSSDHLSMICTSAVRESLANVFGDKFDSFTRNFEKSFGSTLRTLRLISESGVCHGKNLNIESSTSGIVSKNTGACAGNSCINSGHSERPWPTIVNQNRLSMPKEVQEDCIDQGNAVHADVVIFQSDTSKNKVVCTSNDGVSDCHSETELPTAAIIDYLSTPEDPQEQMSTDGQLALHEQTNQLVSVSSSTLGSVVNQSMISTIEKSVMEQVRSNDLKALELGLTVERLKLKEKQLALNYDSNHLKRSELAMGVSMASFKAEKFKNQLEDMRHAELLKMCIDCLVAGLLIMLLSLSYGTYVFSYKRITEATAACAPFSQESKSWWIPKPVASFNSGLHLIMCHVQVLSRMFFGVLMILAIVYLLLQRSAASRQTMPVTFVLLLLGIACGFAGKFCVDTLGGSGYHWLLHWEVLCLLHFFSNMWTSALFLILYGPVPASQGMKSNPMIPYWVRRLTFYVIVPVTLPLLCGLMPFAGPFEWKDHFSMLITDLLSVTDD